ncbi:hypothetical protein NUM_37330 [Actinocatenispora comari]|uniref:DUF397 domain-containing protein n=1 Tax=Actinocatenispora comari TaxID=2807577 RepID=A0A8J4EP80_9ACTN|nr:hypothetical protein NUM_37330 [Actinocatenispora comari]
MPPIGRWFKSSRSTNNAACLEVKFERTGEWFKSSRSSSNASCVEVRFAGAVGVRDSKDRSGPTLDVDAAAWRAFVTTVRAGQYD